MKFLEAKAMQNKMRSGTRSDQIDPSKPSTEEMKIRPEVSALANSLGIDVTRVLGSGKNGQVLMRDVREAASARDHTPDDASLDEEQP